MKRIASTILAASFIATNISPAINVFADEVLKQNLKVIEENVIKEAKVRSFGVSQDNLQRYNSEFKVDKSKIINATNTGGTSNQTNIKNVLDGDLNTFWESGRVNTDSYKNEVEFEFDELTEINRIVYSAKRGTNRGFAEEFEIYVSRTSQGETFELISTGKATATQDTLEFMFDPTEVKRVKFVYKKGVQGWAAASEIGFYKEDPIKDKVQGLFTDSTYSKVSEEFNDFNAIQALEEESKSHILYNDFKEDIENAKALVERGEVEVTKAKVVDFGVSDSNLESYNKEFKIDREKIIKVTNTGGTSNRTKIEDVLDGDLNTRWQSGSLNTDSYKNEVEFHFDETITMNRIVYANERGTNRGFAQEFEIYASPTTKGDNFKLISTGNAKPTQNVLEFKFKPTDIRRVKFVYKNGVDRWSSAAEFGFYREDKIKEKVEGLFTDSTYSKVSEEFNNLDAIQALEEEVKSHALYSDFKESIESAKALIKRGEVEVTRAEVLSFGVNNNNLEAYNEEFKIKRDEITKVTNTGGISNQTKIENILDNDLNTFWESGSVNTDTYKNEVNFEFNDTKKINRIVYSAKRGTNRGFAEEFEIYTSPTTKGDNFKLISVGNTIATQDTLEFKFEPTDIKRLKFVYKKGVQGWAAASEIGFYTEDTIKDKFNGLFTDKTMSSVKPEYSSIEAISKLEEEIVNHPLRDQLQERLNLALSIINNDVDFSNNLFTLNQHGDIVKHARENLKLTSYGTNLQPTGIVAKPGEVFNIYVEAEEDKPLPKVAFTQQEGNYGNWIRTYSLNRGVNTITVPEIYNEGWSKKSNRGGAVYLINPYTPEQQGKSPIVRIDGGEHFPLFNKGDNKEEFLTELKNYKKKLDQNPNTMVDIFEFNTDRLMFTGTASAAYKVYIDENRDLDTSIDTWNKQLEEGYKLAGLSDEEEDIRHNSKNLKTPIRLMQPFGAAYAASDHIGLQRHVMDIFLREDKSSMNSIIWGTMHEVGHQMDIPARTWGEVTNNMWANHASILNGKGDQINYNNIYKQISADGAKRADENVILEMFWQLQLADENYWANLERMYREENPTVNDYQHKKDILAKYSSEILGMNLAPYFEKYNFTLSEECKSELAKLPDMKKIWYLNTKAIDYKGNGFTDNLKLEITSLEYKDEKGNVLEFNIDEENKSNVLGYEIVKDKKVIGFTTGNTFTDENANINENSNYEVIPYDIKLQPGEKSSAQSHSPNLVLSQDKVTLGLREEYNAKDYIKVLNYLGEDIKDNVVVEGNVNTNEKGIYNITYSITDEGITVSKSIEVEVVSVYDYLSDYEWKSATTEWDRARKNKNIKVRQLGEIKTFEKGLGIHANGKIIYDLSDKNYDKFEALLGVDMGIKAQTRSSIKFKIIGDGKVLVSTDTIKYDDDAVYVNVDVKGVNELTIEVNDAGNGNSSDHAVIANPKLTTNNTKPKLEIPKSVSTKVNEEIDLNEEYRATDIEDGDITSSVKVSGKVNFNKPGKYPITYTIVDNDKNEVVKTRTVSVVDMRDYKYLSDYNWSSTNNSYTAPRKDISISGNALRLTDENGQEVSYGKGIGAHSNSTITYDLTDKDYAYFTSYVGVDRQVFGSVGSIIFKVYVDGELKFDSNLMNSTDSKQYVEVDINGAKELKLEVNDGKNGNGSDHGTWGDAKLHFAKEVEANYSELESTLKLAKETDKSLCTEESVLVLEEAINKATRILEERISTQEQIDNIVKELRDSIENLEEYKNLSEIVKFKDYSLKRDIKLALGITANDITVGDMLKLKELSDCYMISSLEGLQYAKNLEVLNLEGSEVSDLSPIKDLKKLKSVNIMNQFLVGGEKDIIDGKVVIKDEIFDVDKNIIIPEEILTGDVGNLTSVEFELRDGNIVINESELKNGYNKIFIKYNALGGKYSMQTYYIVDKK